jgi:hypothetical protein
MGNMFINKIGADAGALFPLDVALSCPEYPWKVGGLKLSDIW